MSSYALQSIWHLVKNFYVHLLKQVYIYVMSVELYCLTQVQSLFGFWNFSRKPRFSTFKSYPENLFQNLSIFWGWAQKQKCRAQQVIQNLFLEFFKLFRKIWSNSKRRNSLNFPIRIQKFISKSRPNQEMVIKAKLQNF